MSNIASRLARLATGDALSSRAQRRSDVIPASPWLRARFAAGRADMRRSETPRSRSAHRRRWRSRTGFSWALAVAVLSGCVSGEKVAGEASEVDLSIMTFNIEYGGDRVDFGQVVKAIEVAGADVVGVQEAWGHIPRLAGELGWEYADSRMQVVSRYPLIDPGGADGKYLFVELLPGRVVALGNVHLPSEPYGPSEVRDGASPDKVLELERRVRVPAIAEPLAALSILAASGIPSFLTGDLNSPSAEDWSATAVGLRPHVRYELDWPVSRAVEKAGFRDSYRALHPDVLAEPGLTWPAGRRQVVGWNPGPDETQERIDFVFAAGDATAVASRIVGEAGAPEVALSVEPWPTDHRGVVSTFCVRPAKAPVFVAVEKRAVTVGEALQVAFGAPGSEGVYIAMREVDPEIAGSVVAERSSRVDGREHGTLLMRTDALPAGAYEVVLMGVGKRELARADVWLFLPGASPEVRLDRKQTLPGEALEVEWSRAPGNRWDWVGVYAADTDPQVDAPLLWRYTGATIVGSTILDGTAEGGGWPLPAGEYSVSLFVDDGYEQIASTPLTVSD